MVPANSDTEKTESETQPQGEHSNALALGVMDEAQLLWRDVRNLIADHLQLVALETQRMGESLVTMLVCGLVIGVLLVSAWIGLSGVLVLLLIHIGIVAYLALLIAVLLNFVGVFLLIMVIRHKSYHLSFPATVNSLRQLLESTSASPSSESAS